MEDYLDDNGWVAGERNNIIVKEAMTKAQVDAGRRYNGEKNVCIAFNLPPKFNKPDTSYGNFIGNKVGQESLQTIEGDLRVLWETLAPGSTVVRTSPTTTTIKEQGVRGVKGEQW